MCQIQFFSLHLFVSLCLFVGVVKHDWEVLHGSISPTFYEQLLHAQTPKAQKIQSSPCWFLFALLGSTNVQAVCKMLVRLTPGVKFIIILCEAFAQVDPKSVKRYWQLGRILMLLGAMLVKGFCKDVGEIDSWSLRRSSMHERSFNRIRGCLKEKDKKWRI